MDKIYSRLRELQADLKAPKNQRNSFGNYNYRSAEDILEALKPLAVKHSLTFFIEDEIVEVGGRVYVKACVYAHDDDGGIITSTAYAREEENKKGMDGSQVTGAASSYARKYALNGLLLIDDTKDSDATNTHGKGSLSSSKPQATAKPSTGKSSSEIMDGAVNYIKGQADKQKAYESVIKKYGNDLTDKQKEALKKFVR